MNPRGCAEKMEDGLHSSEQDLPYTLDDSHLRKTKGQRGSDDGFVVSLNKKMTYLLRFSNT